MWDVNNWFKGPPRGAQWLVVRALISQGPHNATHKFPIAIFAGGHMFASISGTRSYAGSFFLRNAIINRTQLVIFRDEVEMLAHIQTNTTRRQSVFGPIWRSTLFKSFIISTVQSTKFNWLYDNRRTACCFRLIRSLRLVLSRSFQVDRCSNEVSADKRHLQEVIELTEQFDNW